MLQQQAAQRASVLQGLGSGQSGQHFIIAHGQSPAFIADLLAVWSVGGVAACVSPSLTAAELANVARFIDAPAILVREAAPHVSGTRLIDLEREQASKTASTIEVRPQDPALILFTSGTTGEPKGVVHTHASLQARIALNRSVIGDKVLARTLCVLPTHFGHGLIGNSLTPLMAGAELHLMPSAGLATAQQLGSIVTAHEISFMSSVPSFWNLALKLSAPPRPGLLQRVQIGSAPLAASLWRRVIEWAGTRCVGNVYGTTETANWIGGAMATEFEPEDGLVGRMWGGEWAVLDDGGCMQPQGEGEVLVRSPSIMQGYLHRRDLTDEVMHEGWYRTGDRGRIDHQGVLRLTGRERSMINRAGLKVYPEELDLLFERHPAVAEACAFALPDSVAGECVGLAIQLATDAAFATGKAEAELLDWARPQLRSEALPARVFVVPDIPRNERGKINRAAVARHCLGEARS